MLLQAEVIPNPENIKDTVTALIWVVGFMVAVIIAMAVFVRSVLNKQEAQYEKQITYLTATLAESEAEVKELNAKVIDNIVPTINTLNTTLGKLIEKSR